MWIYYVPSHTAAAAGFVAAWAVNDDEVPRQMKKNVASQVVGMQMVDASDGSAFTGSVTVSVTGDAGTQATGSVGSGACTHEGNGYHTYAPAQAETNYDQIGFTFTGTGAIPRTLTVYTTFPQTGDNFARLGAPAGASVSADVAAVKAVLPAALVSGRMDASVGAMANNVMTAAAAAADLTTELQSGLATASALSTVEGKIDTVDTVVDAIKVKTDNLPSDPADASDIASAFGTVNSTLGTIAGYIDTEVAAIKAKTDNLPSDPADASDIATAFGTVNSSLSAIAIVTDKLNGMIEEPGSSPSYNRFKESTLEQAPSGTGSSPSAIADEVQTRTIAGVTTVGTVNALANNSVTAAALAADAVTEIQSGLATASALSTVEGKVDTVDTVVDAIKAKTDNLPSDPADASDIASSFGTVNTTLGTIAGYIDTEVAAIKAKTDNLPASPAATGDIPSAASIASAVWSSVMEGSHTAIQFMRGFAATLLGKASGMATTTAVFRDIDDSKDRVTATVDADGNRSAVTTDLT